jgi:hypothetical protein
MTKLKAENRVEIAGDINTTLELISKEVPEKIKALGMPDFVVRDVKVDLRPGFRKTYVYLESPFTGATFAKVAKGLGCKRVKPWYDGNVRVLVYPVSNGKLVRVFPRKDGRIVFDLTFKRPHV